ncbi:6-phosphofructokinase [Butyrivibrio sp. M55]|uniref:6-phosphofructokinase n=1 Tax=Butyrivibrio sp. M55 TaxID=1855323 RepID=UPI0008EF75EA|nr:6-phosphofructokinase [Butyrivibrio sp. M55]SFU69410.1 6-phosphofructokinase [Butyrivibrio sp. M55]
MNNVIIGQSGGPTAAINASVAGAYVRAKELGAQKVFGMLHGIEGLVNGNIIDLDKYLSDPTNVELLKRTPASVLGTCRYKLSDASKDDTDYKKIFDVLEKNNIDKLFYVGGNDSMDTIMQLSDYAKDHGKTQRFIGIPKTIDNDLPVTDHCPGFGSAAKYIATSVKELIRDNQAADTRNPATVIVEIMGRNAGWLAASAALSKADDCTGPDAIYLPEKPFDMDAFMKHMKELSDKKKPILIAISEGIKLADGTYVCELGGDVATDAFGHKQMSAACKVLSDKLSSELGLRTRTVELSTLQRAASHMASLTDVREAYQCGFEAVNAANAGETGKMIIMKRMVYQTGGTDNNWSSECPYMCSYGTYDIHSIANYEKMVPDEWITPDGCGLTEQFEKYARPLIFGEVTPIMAGGLPRHLVIKEAL